MSVSRSPAAQASPKRIHKFGLPTDDSVTADWSASGARPCRRMRGVGAWVRGRTREPRGCRRRPRRRPQRRGERPELRSGPRVLALCETKHCRALSGPPDLDARGHHCGGVGRLQDGQRLTFCEGSRTGAHGSGPMRTQPRHELETAVPGGRSPRWELNPRPTPYQGVALPLSYLGPRRAMVPTDLWTASRGL